MASGSYEKVCVLFNIGAMASQIGEGQNVGSDDGLKTAAKLFMVNSLYSLLIVTMKIFTYKCIIVYTHNNSFISLQCAMFSSNWSHCLSCICSSYIIMQQKCSTSSFASFESHLNMLRNTRLC